MNWSPEIKFEKSAYPHTHILGSKIHGNSLLDKALQKWMDAHGDMARRAIKDRTGRTGYWVEGGCIIVAKRYIYGYIVSFTERIVDFAERHDLKICLYIEDGDRFYDFNPKAVREQSIPNIFNGQRMLNCDIKLGERHECERCGG